MISVIVCSIDPRKREAVASNYAQALASEPYELIVIDDARSLCDGYNRGLARARGEIAVFSHDDIELLCDDLGGILRRRLNTFAGIGVAGTTRLAAMGWAQSGIRHARGVITRGSARGFDIQLFGATELVSVDIQALDGVWFATRRDVAEQIKFDADTFDGWHGYDIDFTFRCHLAGFRLAVTLEVKLIHFSFGTLDRAWLVYEQRFREKHAQVLRPERGAWLDVWKRVHTRAEILAAYEPAELRALTAEVYARAGG